MAAAMSKYTDYKIAIICKKEKQQKLLVMKRYSFKKAALYEREVI
jgi:hypothetical protein